MIGSGVADFSARLPSHSEAKVLTRPQAFSSWSIRRTCFSSVSPWRNFFLPASSKSTASGKLLQMKYDSLEASSKSFRGRIASASFGRLSSSTRKRK